MAATCKKCGASIVWIESPKHKWIPCDEWMIAYQEDRSGKDAIVTQNGEIIRCRLAFDGPATGMGRLAHWATCPNADDFRKRK